MNKAKLFAVVWLSVLTCSLVWGQEQKAQPGDMSSMDPAMADMPASGPSADIGAEHAMQSMEGRHMDMGPHMKMTNLRNLSPGDQEHADKLVARVRAAAERYQDYNAALNDGLKMFVTEVPQKQYQFITTRTANDAQFQVSTEHPTS